MTLDHNRMSGPSLHSHCSAQTNQFKAEIYTTHYMYLLLKTTGRYFFYQQGQVFETFSDYICQSDITNRIKI